MAKLKIKNKYQLTLKKLVKETIAEGGVPDIIEIDGQEAWQILNEMRALRNRGFRIETKDVFDPEFILRSSKEKLDMSTAKDLITRWFKKEFGILFAYDATTKIPLIVMGNKKAKTKTVKIEVKKVDTPPKMGDNTPNAGEDKSKE